MIKDLVSRGNEPKWLKVWKWHRTEAVNAVGVRQKWLASIVRKWDENEAEMASIVKKCGGSEAEMTSSVRKWDEIEVEMASIVRKWVAEMVTIVEMGQE